jgi:hypothetical protein
MPHPRRFDFIGAIHLVRLRGRAGTHIFFEPGLLTLPPTAWWASAPRVQGFLHFMKESLEECDSVLFGYHFQPNEAGLLLQTASVSLERLMQRLCGSYSRYCRKTFAESALAQTKGPFAGRYDSKVIAPEYLPHALRRLHRQGKPATLNAGAPYGFSSEQAYVGTRARVPLGMAAVHAVLAARGLGGLPGYRKFMQEPESAHIAALFANGSPHDRHIVGNRAFVLKAHDAATHPLPAPTREQLIAAVAQRLGRAPDELAIGQRVGVLARSMVAWYGLRTGAASLSDVGRWFSVSGATVGRGMRFYRRTVPQYFGATLPGLKDEPDT